MGISPQTWRERAADLQYPNAKAEASLRKEGEAIIREKSAPIVRAALNDLHEIHLQAGEMADQAVEASTQAKEALRSAERRELSVAELRKRRDQVWRAELLTEQTIEDLRTSIQFAKYRRDKPDDYLGRLAEKYKLELGLPHI